MTRAVVFAAGAGVAAVVAAAGIAVAQPSEAPRAGRDITRDEVIQRVDERFTRLDENRDGRVTSEERRSAAQRRRIERADRMFDRLDADRDGAISREEMREGRMNRGGRRATRMAGPGGPGMEGSGYGRRGPGIGGRRFAMREVTREEMRERALARFDRVDANRDGTLTLEERRQAREQRRERRRMRMQDARES